MEILNKRQSTDGYKNGRFGNHLRQWDEPFQALSDGAHRWSIRYRGPGANGPCIYHLTAEELLRKWAMLTAFGNFDAKHLYVSESAPDDKLTFQGEIVEHAPSGGYALHWCPLQAPQRVALASKYARHKQGPGAKLLCKQFMDHDSYEDLLTLLDLYPLHVIEFSCFAVRLGNLRRNTIFWEVRKF